MEKEIVWDAYPWSRKVFHEPRRRTPTQYGKIKYTRRRPVRPTVHPDDELVAILRKKYPDCNVEDPPWQDIWADLIAGGVDAETIRDLESLMAVRLLGRIEGRIHPSNADIPSQIEWTKPISKREAARYLGCPSTNKAEWINLCVDDGELKIKKCTRQSFQFNLDAFPPEYHAKLRVTVPK